MKERDFRVDDGRIQAYYPGSDILMYEIEMSPIDGDNTYNFPRKFLINAMRKRSGLCALVNDDALRGIRGSAAMIDYINDEQIHGGMDNKFMYGSVDAVRSRIRKIEEISSGFAKESINRGEEFCFYEAGSGFLRLPLLILESLKEDGYRQDLVYIGTDRNPDVVETASKIAEFRGVSDKIRVCHGDALKALQSLDKELDLVLAEGAMEYWEPDYCKAFAEESRRHLKNGGRLVATATHEIPKEKIAKILDFYFEPKSEDEFKEIFTDTGFGEPRLIKTEPPNISIGIARNSNRA